ncbi:MAG TPA: alpha-amylase family protein [Lacisediminihabitans sp.]|uniref:alpha-amylase family protein n=1 Tax=Lacisediminihabitans sp. TaxID=2787631 RepID=UPI002ED944FA
MSGWIDDAIWWQVYPLGFVGADTTGGAVRGEPHRLRRLVPWLDQLIELGCNGLALGPIFASSTHGYDTIDHFRIDPRLGDEKDFDLLVRECRARGIRVMLDGVFNHVGREHPRWLAAVSAGPGSQEAAWFLTDGSAGGELRPAVFEGHDALVTLNHENPEVEAFVSGVMGFWLDRGADAWRLDAAYAVPAGFWRRTIGPLRAGHPDAWFLGEMIHGDYAGYVAESGIDSVTQYELWKAIWSSINDHNFFELAWALKRHASLLEAFLPLTFVGNHDVTRIASRLGDERDLGLALALLFFLPGTPSVYYGDERGLRAIKEDRAGGDDAIRPSFPIDPAELPPNDVFRLHQRLIAFRRRNPWLARATVSVETLRNEVLGLHAAGEGGQEARLALNLSDEPVSSGGVTIEPHGWMLG